MPKIPQTVINHQSDKIKANRRICGIHAKELKRCELYCPEDRENLVNSSLTNSIEGRRKGSSALGYSICAYAVLW